MKRKVVSIFIIVLTIIFTVPLDSFATTNSNVTRFRSIVQSYTPTTESFKLTKSSRFYIAVEYEPKGPVSRAVQLLASEFAKKGKPSSTPLDIVYGPLDKARPSDIVISLKSSGYSYEGYRLEIGDKVVLNARTSAGVFYGLRTLLQYRICSESNTLKGCVIKDSPDVTERVAHLDCARKYFSKTWIKSFIRKMSWQRYNAIEIHFSEDQGLRLQSKKFPWLAGSYNQSKGVLSQADMEDICNTAKKYHVEIIPSFDSPGHLNYLTKKYRNYVVAHPNYSFTYNGRKYSKTTTGFSNISNYFKYNGKKSSYKYLGINLANPTAKAFVNALIDEYADFFKKQGCKKFNIGGDELLGWSSFSLGGKYFTGGNKWYALQHWDYYARKYLKVKNGNARDTFIYYMNTVSKRLEGKGYKCRVWNDEINRFSNQHIALRKTVDIVYWSSNYTPLSTLAAKGYDFYNAMESWTYYVTNPHKTYVGGESIYNGWNPRSFGKRGGATKIVSSSQYKGAYFCVWCDYATAKSSTTIWTNISRRMWANGTKMWNRHINQSLSYTSFKTLVDKIGVYPGYQGSPNKLTSLPSAPTITKAE